jgi:predicted nucleotidyltransferase
MKDEIARVAQTLPYLKLVILFGSAAKGRLTPHSDVDIAVAADFVLSFEEKTDLMIRFSEALHREVDLIDLNAVSGPILQEVFGSGQIIVKKSTSLLVNLLKKMWYHQADMMPYINMIVKEQLKRFVNG